MTVVLPTIHMNGSSGERLLEDTEAACRAVVVAIDALCAAAPNARDYYPQGPTAWPAADDAHRARLAKLIEVRNELNALHEGIYDQVEARKRR